MAQTIKIREVLGITQEQASQLLGVSRTYFAMYETGKRDLPTPVLLKLTKLWQLLNEKPNEKSDSYYLSEYNKVDTLNFIEDQINDTKLKQLNLEKKQKKIKANHIKNQNALQLITFLKNEAKSEKEEELLESIENEVLKKLEKNNWKVQLELQFKIDSLKLQHEHLIAQKKSLSNFDSTDVI